MNPIALIVDDEPLVRMYTADIIADEGFHVIEAESAATAISYLVDHPDVCLVVTDIQMPGIDGLTFAHHVAARWPEIAVIIASGAVQPTQAKMPSDARFIAKPISPVSVARTIKEVRSLH